MPPLSGVNGTFYVLIDGKKEKISILGISQSNARWY
jgi:hypothetical protein